MNRLLDSAFTTINMFPHINRGAVTSEESVCAQDFKIPWESETRPPHRAFSSL